ncbi:LAME_0G00760g1_1 [Lachancea meyersii CBS 8951]|uniref:ADP-ribosylation factor GTPase-activating protein n=1 Tax=Lachancea meyersii CBS 8951 TaxID=1266667 RepID=A0A1G4K501_9SACH|nr:LAME_0G00760g1_1 [Lachancea meyersii CBS 8951]
MSSNAALLKLCGEVGDELIDLFPASPSSLPKFILCSTGHRQQLALLASHKSFEYTVKYFMPNDETFHSALGSTFPADVVCSASQGSNTLNLPFTDLEPRENGSFSFTMSIYPLLTISGHHTVRIKVRSHLIVSIALWVDPVPAKHDRKPESTPPPALVPSHKPSSFLQYPFQPDGPQFRTLISHRENLIPTLRQSLKYMQERCAKVIDSLNATTREIAGLISCAQDLASLSPSFPREFNSVTSALISTLKLTLESQRRLETVVLQNFNSPVDNYISSIDLKAVSARRKQYHDQAKVFYSYMGKNLSSADSTNLTKKIQFELQRFDYYVYLTELIDGSSARRFLHEISKFSSKLGPANLASLVEHTKNYQAGLKFSKSRIKSMRDQISHSKSFSDFSSQNPVDPHKIHKEGILWTHKGHGKSSGWHKQWVVLDEFTLSEYSDWKTQGNKLSHSPLKLTFACIKKQDSGNFNGFEIITTDGVTRSFRAESKSELEQWLKILQEAVGAGVQMPPENVEQSAIKAYTELVSNADKSNTICCDCGGTNQVEWVSINLLCVVCIKCSSVHRSLGAHHSKMRSLKLDTFTSKEILELLNYVSNNNVNSIYEAELHEKILDLDSSSQQRTDFITDKYVNRKFVSALEEKEPEAIDKRLTHNLIKSIHLNSIYLLQQCIAQGVHLNKVHLDHGETVFQYSLKHYQGTKDNPTFFITEFLLLNGLLVGRLPRDASALSKSEYDYWRSKAETNGVYNIRPINRRASSRESTKAEIKKIDTSMTGPLPTRKVSSASDASENVNKRWSISGSLPLSSPATASIIHSKNLGIKFSKKSGNKN